MGARSMAWPVDREDLMLLSEKFGKEREIPRTMADRVKADDRKSVSRSRHGESDAGSIQHPVVGRNSPLHGPASH
jgi:hypothetical protein